MELEKIEELDLQRNITWPHPSAALAPGDHLQRVPADGRARQSDKEERALTAIVSNRLTKSSIISTQGSRGARLRSDLLSLRVELQRGVAQKRHLPLLLKSTGKSPQGHAQKYMLLLRRQDYLQSQTQPTHRSMAHRTQKSQNGTSGTRPRRVDHRRCSQKLSTISAA